MSKPIVVVGSISMDMVSCTPRIPAVGETVIGTSFSTTPGGKGANQSVAAARLGYPTQMVGGVGDDAYGRPLLEALSEAGVDIAGMEPSPGASGLAHIFLAEDGHNSIVIVQGANGRVDRAHIDRHANLIRSAGIVLCQLELPLETTCYTIELAAAVGVPVMLDPAPAASLPDSLFGRIAWFTPNETEAALYVGDAGVEEAAEKLFAKGVKGVALKRGAEGAYVAVAGGRAEWVRAFPVQAVDTVAAGDCFNGAFAVALLEGRDPWAAARFASAAAAICVTRRGAQASMPSRAEVEAFLRGAGNREWGVTR
ncbi:MAG TPA: ribokinase [Terracidiphilus sp.]|nr:ribokinase [Terracidiphilus sp.]